jgi:hypothetical protein
VQKWKKDPGGSGSSGSSFCTCTVLIALLLFFLQGTQSIGLTLLKSTNFTDQFNVFVSCNKFLCMCIYMYLLVFSYTKYQIVLAAAGLKYQIGH